MVDVGDIIGEKYLLVAKIGEGGMGIVWKAKHQHLGHDIAVKFLTHLASNSEPVVARFLDEARTAASVRHRNVVHILDFGVAGDGRPYMVMEYLEGESLADRLCRKPPLSLAETAQTIGLTLSGLAAVHDRGIIHRDLKPENIFLTYDADGFFPKILDFGVSKDLVKDEGGGRRVKTRDGVLLGTPQYMSPEQARGIRDIDKRTDVYAMGVILYELLTGILPFDAENIGDILMKVIQGEHPKIASLRPDLPQALIDVVERAMAVDREARFPDAREMRNALFAGMATARPGAFGITDPSGALNAELASAVVAALAKNNPSSASPDAPRTANSNAVPITNRDPTPRDPTPRDPVIPRANPPPPRDSRPSTTSIDETTPFRTDFDEKSVMARLPPPRQPGSGGERGNEDPTTKVADPTGLLASPRLTTELAASDANWTPKILLTLLFALVLGMAALELREPGTLMTGLRGTGRLFGALFGGGAGEVDAGVEPSDAGVPDGGMILVRFRPVPDEAVVTLAGRVYSPEEIAQHRSDAGLVTFEIPRLDEEVDIKVEAPGYQPFESRRIASTNLSFRLRMRSLDAGVDAGAPEEPPSRPSRRRRR